MKNLVFTTRKTCAIESFCLRSLPTTEKDITALKHLLYWTKDSTNFSELLEEFNGNEKFVPLVISMIRTETMTADLYWKVYKQYGSNKKVIEELILTKYSDNSENVIPKEMYDQLTA